MSRSKFNRLVENIRRMNLYEPVTVRPIGDGRYEILNGHNRVKALEKLGYKKVQVVIWDIDDIQADIFLASLNRLSGSDEPCKKAELLRRLNRKISAAELSGILPVTQEQIRKLVSLKVPDIKGIAGKCSRVNMPESVFFFLEPRQKKILDSAMSLALHNCKAGTKARKNTEAITQICRDFIRYSKEKKIKSEQQDGGDIING